MLYLHILGISSELSLAGENEDTPHYFREDLSLLHARSVLPTSLCRSRYLISDIIYISTQSSISIYIKYRAAKGARPLYIRPDERGHTIIAKRCRVSVFRLYGVSYADVRSDLHFRLMILSSQAHCYYTRLRASLLPVRAADIVYQGRLPRNSWSEYWWIGFSAYHQRTSARAVYIAPRHNRKRARHALPQV